MQILPSAHDKVSNYEVAAAKSNAPQVRQSFASGSIESLEHLITQLEHVLEKVPSGPTKPTENRVEPFHLLLLSRKWALFCMLYHKSHAFCVPKCCY